MKRKKGYDYYEMFIRMGGHACNMAESLQDILKNFKAEELPEKMKELHEIEHDADAETHEMMKNLAKEFLPPIEREDIIVLAQQLDDVVDSIEDILLRFYMYNVQEIRYEAIEFMDILVECCNKIKQMMEEFASFRKSAKIHEYIVEINHLEDDGDRLYIEAIRKLYVEDNDVMNILIWTQIFQCFEDCCDVCEDVSESVESVIMKNI